jgi:folate-binding protein YgfZ
MQNFYSTLAQLDLIRIAGKDSGKLLQGQLSCDVSALPEPGSCPACLCDNKGRVLASFLLWKIQKDFYLEMMPGLADTVLTNLKKYAVFYQCEITHNNGFFKRYALAGEQAQAMLQKQFRPLPSDEKTTIAQDGCYLRLVDHEQLQFELWLKPEDHFNNVNLSETPLTQWLQLDQQRGLYHLQADDSGLYTPQELNYDLLGHVSFTKGCYTGQEIVARMHYRGKAKKRLHAFLLDSDKPPKKHEKILTPGGSSMGEVLQSHLTSQNQFHLLAVSSEPDTKNLYLEHQPQALLKALPLQH